MFSIFKFSMIKLFHFKKFYFSLLNIFSPFTEIELGRKSYLKLSKLVKARSGVKIKIRDNAHVEIGEGTSFNYDCMVVSHDKIKIGNNVQFGPHVYIYDHDHDYRAKDGLEKLKYKTGPVTIGNNVWIGANAIILRDTFIGDNCVVGAGTVVKGNFPNNSVITQNRQMNVVEYLIEEKG